MKYFSKLKDKLRSQQRHGRDESSVERPVTAPSSTSQHHASGSATIPGDSEITQGINSLVSGLSPAASPLPPTASPDTEDTPPSIPGRLWNAAYAAIEKKEPDIVKVYEKILLNVQKEWDNTTAPAELEELEQSKAIGSSNMWRLIYTGLERSKRQAERKESVSSVIQIVDNIKGVVDKAVKYSPEAGVVWAGVGLGLEIISNPMKEPGLNRKGLVHVLSRMEWYWNLADLVLNENTSTSSSNALRTTLETHVIDFYKKLLLFQMRSACLYYRNWVLIILGDAVKLDDWAEKLKEIKDAEIQIRDDIKQYNSEEVKSRLQGMEKSAVLQEQVLADIYNVMREQARLIEKNKQNDEDRKCLKSLLITDPRDDRTRLQEQKATPLLDSYAWILRNSKYKKFLDDPESRVLWINRLPGKGKTMLVLGLLDELAKTARPLPFFLCQANVNQEDRSSYNAAIRGLIYMLLDYQPSLMTIIRGHYDKLEERLFNGSGSIRLRGILKEMLEDPSLHDTILVIDALDECQVDRLQLTNLVVQLSTLSNVKWMVSSRDWPDIGQELASATGLISLNLSEEDDEVAAAVNSYIRTRVNGLETRWGNDKALRESVFNYMQSHADNTFLWVSLVCERLAQSNVGKRRVMEELRRFPQSLKSLYQLMLQRIMESDEAPLLKEILALACVAYRPVEAAEVTTLIPSMETYNEHSVKDVIGYCGSFITYQNGAIFFVHQSAKEFLLDDGNEAIFSQGIAYQHSRVFLRSLQCMEHVLREDLYDLRSPGTLIDDISPPNPDPLHSIKYLCLYWAKHLLDSEAEDIKSQQYLERTHDFLRKELLYWLEALSLLREMSIAVKTILELESIPMIQQLPDFAQFIKDSRRFIYQFKQVIQKAPLQVYVSALIFSPQRSDIREAFDSHTPNWITSKPEMPHEWEPYDQSIYVGSKVFSVAYSTDGKFLAVKNEYGSEVYETVSGDLAFQLQLNSNSVREFAPVFSQQNDLLAAQVEEDIIGIFQTGGFELLQKLEYPCRQVLFMPCGERLVIVGNGDITVLYWKTQQQVFHLRNAVAGFSTITLLPDGAIISVCPAGDKVNIWDGTTVYRKHILRMDRLNLGHFTGTFACSANGRRIAVLESFRVQVWDLDATDKWTRGLVIREKATALSLSADGRLIIVGFSSGHIKIFEDTGTNISTLKGHNEYIPCLSLSHANQKLVSGSLDNTFKVWDLSTICKGHIRAHDSTSIVPPEPTDSFFRNDQTNNIRAIRFSPSGKLLITDVWLEDIKIWYADSNFGRAPLTSRGSSSYRLVSFTPGDGLLAVAGKDDYLTVWDTTTGKQIRAFAIGKNPVNIFLSADGKRIALLHQPNDDSTRTLKIYDLAQTMPSNFIITDQIIDGAGLQREATISDDFNNVTFSPFGWKITVLSCNLPVWHRYDYLLNGSYILLAMSQDTQWILIGKLPNKFHILKLLAREIVIELQFPKSEGCSNSLPNSTGISCRIPTRFGTIGLGEEGMEEKATRIGWGMTIDREWIMRDNERMIWVPPEYRHLAVDTHGSRVAFACPSGKLAMMELQPTD